MSELESPNPGEVSSPLAEILVVDDEVAFAKAVTRRLERSGYACRHEASLAASREAVRAREFDLVLLDMRLPDGSGLDFLHELRQRGDFPIIVMTAYGEVEDAVTAMKHAASDYLKKPLDLEELVLNVSKVLAVRDTGRRLEYSRAREHSHGGRDELRGRSSAMEAVREQASRIATLGSGPAAPPTLLITGETGTGKDVTARYIHRRSARAERPFVHVDCAALPKDLFESELFGHVKGAFTHAVNERTGLIEAAEDGVVFLDEIGEIPLDLQAKLLALLERRTLRRIGSSTERRSDAWFIAATNRDVEEMVAAGSLRSDLFFRLKVLSLDLPPLRERGEDVLELADYFALEIGRRYAIEGASFTDGARRVMRAYHWPGNVRELAHLVERAVLLSGGGSIDEHGLGLMAPDPTAAGGTDMAALDGLTLEDVERLMLQRALEASEGNVSEAARRLGLTRMAMRYRLDKHGLRDGG